MMLLIGRLAGMRVTRPSGLLPVCLSLGNNALWPRRHTLRRGMFPGEQLGKERGKNTTAAVTPRTDQNVWSNLQR